MNGAECLLRTLVSNGIEVCFMNPGTSEMQFVAALDRVAGMRPVLCLFEGVCSGAADGYARMSGRPASTLLHLGPGLANGLANFHNARKAKSPVVSIVGEHSTQHLKHDAPLTADIDLFARTVSNDVFRPKSAEEIGRFAACAVAAARRPPGQVAHLIVPADFSWSESGDPGPVLERPKRRIPDSQQIERIRKLTRSGANVGLLLSGGALLDDGLAAAERLCGLGVRIFANRNAGRMASGRNTFQPQRIAYFPEDAEEMLAGLEHLILVESKEPISFFGYPGRRSTLVPEGCQLHVLAAEGDDGTAALEMLADGLKAPSREDAPKLELSPEDRFTHHSVARTVAALLPEGAVVSDESLSAGHTVWHHLLRAAPHDHLPVTGGSIGQALPVAVGAAIAGPDRKVVALEADGSGMYTLQALWTMAREQLDVVTVIFANRCYRILETEMKRTGAHGFGPVAANMIDIGRPDLDWVRLAESMGVGASKAAATAQFIDQFESAVRNRGPHLIEAVL
jgi:acetolactate synthase-1/2/3 large subunit